MCNCLKDGKKNILDKLKADKAGVEIINSGDFKNYGFSFGKKSFMRTYNDFEYSMTNIKKDGSQGATKKKTISIYHTYCPYCGGKIRIKR